MKNEELHDKRNNSFYNGVSNRLMGLTLFLEVDV